MPYLKAEWCIMKKLVIRYSLLTLILLLLPYLLTTILSRSSRDNPSHRISQFTITYEANGHVTELSLENYLIGVVAANIPASYHLETLKAQAVIARTYILKNISTLHSLKSSDLTSSTKENTYSTSQLGLSYLSLDELATYYEKDEYQEYLAKIENAVYSTSGEVIQYKEDLITPLFFSTSTGETRDISTVYEVSLPYLKSVVSKDDVLSSDYLTIVIESPETIVLKLNAIYENTAAWNNSTKGLLVVESAQELLDSLTNIVRDDYGYVLTLDFNGTTITGDYFAHLLNLPSSNFYLELYEGNIRILCKGKGHGIGFSQFGGNQLAKEGYGYKELLTYYYSNVNIKTLK